MGRRYDHSRDELRRMMLAAARRIVLHDGLRSLSARRIAQEIGYSPGTLYNVFDNLDDLIVQLNATTLDELDERLSRAAKAEQPAKALLALAQAYIAFSREQQPLWELLFEHRLPADQALPEGFGERVDRLFAVVERALAPLFPPGSEAAKRQAARVLWSSLHGICALGAVNKLGLVGDRSAEAVAEELIRTYLAGLDAPASKPAG